MANIKEFCNMQQLDEIIKQWTKCTGLAAVLLDVDGRNIGENHNFTEFCSDLAFSSTEARIRCEKCRNEENGIYKCHAGLTEFSYPVTLNNGTVVGKIVGGQVLTEQPDDNKLRDMTSAFGANSERYAKSLKKVKIKSHEEIEAAGNLLSTAVDMFVRSSYDKSSNERIKEKLSEASQEITVANKSNKTISEISMNQKILAINASVEAAHAGKAGKGFSIVATEVDRLALMMEDVSDEITESLTNLNRIISELNKA